MKEKIRIEAEIYTVGKYCSSKCPYIMPDNYILFMSTCNLFSFLGREKVILQKYGLKCFRCLACLHAEKGDEV